MKKLLFLFLALFATNVYATSVPVEWDVSDAVVAYYKMDETSGLIVTDETGVNNCTASRDLSSLTTAGVLGTQFNFSAASSDFFDCGSDQTAKQTGNITLEGWLTYSAGSTIRILAGDRSSLGSNIGWELYIDASNFLVFLLDTGSSAYVISSVAIANGVKHHFIVKRTGSTLTMKIDGVATGSASGQLGGDLGTSAGNLYIGRSPRLANYANGKLDNFRMYNRATIDNEDIGLYNNGVGTTATSGTAYIIYPDTTASNVTLNNIAINSIHTPPTPLGLVRLMCSGDSITYGQGTTPVWGYRKPLQDLLGIGVVDFVGSFTDPNSDAIYDVDHDGQASNDSTQVLSRLPANLTTYFTPVTGGSSAIILWAGRNDVGHGHGVIQPVTNNTTMINLITAFDPTIQIYVANALPQTNNLPVDAQLVTYNAGLAAQIATMQATNANLHYIDVRAAFITCNGGDYESCLSDGLHPNATGYQVVANTFYGCINDPLNQYCDFH